MLGMKQQAHRALGRSAVRAIAVHFLGRRVLASNQQITAALPPPACVPCLIGPTMSSSTTTDSHRNPTTLIELSAGHPSCPPAPEPPCAQGLCCGGERAWMHGGTGALHDESSGGGAQCSRLRACVLSICARVSSRGRGVDL